MFSCLICALYEFCPNPVVKPAEGVCEQSIMQFPPWLVLHSEQFVFFTFQEIQSLEWGDYAGITSFFFKEKKIYISHDFIGNLGNICWNDLQVKKKKQYKFVQDSTAGFHLFSADNWDIFLENLASVSGSVGDQKLSPGSGCIKLSSGTGIPQTHLESWGVVWNVQENGKWYQPHFSAQIPFQSRLSQRSNDAAQTLCFWEW